jgi:putative tryptophan/tyrosine transport system permease protein
MGIFADALVTGLPLVPAFMGIYLVFVMRNDFDLTVEAAFTMGGATTAVLLVDGVPVPLAMLAGVAAAGLMGLLTTALHVLLGIPIILAGLIMSIGLYSVNLRILKEPTVSLAGVTTAFSGFQAMTRNQSDLATIVALVAGFLVLFGLLGAFLLTDLGLALRSSGVNQQMARSQGVNDRFATGVALMLANALVGLSGAIVVQNQGFADINMGSGVLLAGIGGVLLGELLVRQSASGVVRAIVAVFVGTLLYRLVLALALRAGLDASDLKAVTAVTLVMVFAVRAASRSLWLRRSDRRYPLPLADQAAIPDPVHGAEAL